MRLIFLYYSEGDRVGMPFNKTKKANNRFVNNFYTEGLDSVFKGLLKYKDSPVTEVVLVVESPHGTGSIQLSENYFAVVTPELKHIEHLMDEDTIIFTRGGFRSWYPYLTKWSDEGRWSWLYAANTGRQKWPFWDIVFNDLEDRTYMDPLGRLQLRYYKPINTDIFKYRKASLDYDFMLGASHVHDKKGQYKAVNAIKYMKQALGLSPRCILPGGIKRGTGTNTIRDTIQKYKLDIELPGMLTREELAQRMNRTKVFIHAGSSGQNDRGPLEAMASGCDLVIASPQYHDPVVHANTDVTVVLPFANDELRFGKNLHCLFELGKAEQGASRIRRNTANAFLTDCSTDCVTARFISLLQFFKANPKRNKQALKDYYIARP